MIIDGIARSLLEPQQVRSMWRTERKISFDEGVMLDAWMHKQWRRWVGAVRCGPARGIRSGSGGTHARGLKSQESRLLKSVGGRGGIIRTVCATAESKRTRDRARVSTEQRRWAEKAAGSAARTVPT